MLGYFIDTNIITSFEFKNDGTQLGIRRFVHNDID